MTGLEAVEWCRRWAQRIRDVATTESDDFRAIAETRAKACEDMANALEATCREDKTPPVGTWVGPNAKPQDPEP